MVKRRWTAYRPQHLNFVSSLDFFIASISRMGSCRSFQLGTTDEHRQNSSKEKNLFPIAKQLGERWPNRLGNPWILTGGFTGGEPIFYPIPNSCSLEEGSSSPVFLEDWVRSWSSILCPTKQTVFLLYSRVQYKYVRWQSRELTMIPYFS